MNNQPNMPRRGTRRALNAAVTAAVIAVVLVVNVLFSFVADRFMWQVDETVTRYVDKKGNPVGSMYTATEEFLDVVREYAIPMVEEMNAERAQKGEEPITINIKFCSERDKVYEADKLRMIQYTVLALQKEFPDAVKVEYLNIEQNPSQVQKYKATSSTNIYSHQIIFEFGTEYRVCSYDYFFLKSDSSSTDHWAYNGEQKIASLLLALTRAESPIAAFITNHGEPLESCQSFRTLVERAGFDVMDIDLSKDEIPADCRLLICYDPQTDFIGLGNAAYVEGDESEIDKLDAFLDKAYSFMLFVDKDTPELPVLEEYLEEWGVTVARAENAEGDLDTLTIRDPAMKLDKDGYIPLAEYVTAGGGASITEDMRQVSYPAKVVFPNATAITMSESYRKTHVVPDDTNGVTEAYTYGSYYRNGVSRYFHDVFKTGSSAVAEAFGEQYRIATQQERFNLMTISIESRSVKETNYLSTQEPSYVAVFGSTEFASDTVLDSAAYGNADALTATLRHMGREVMPADLEFKAFKVYTVDTDAYTVNTGGVIAITVCMTLLPIAVCIVVGVCVNVKRKYR
ncbi:MAG: Gldg family protein [Clostridia bacterium]|nr:Gldg family protein [Clostridia bacterium]